MVDLSTSLKIALLLDRIESTLASRYHPHPGLMNGMGGVILFYAYLYKYSGRESHLDRCTTLLNTYIEQIGSTSLDFSLAGGVTGCAWLMQHLINISVLPSEEVELARSLDGYVLAAVKADQQAKQYDALYGLIGKGLYFIESYPELNASLGLTNVINALSEIAERTPSGLTWRYNLTMDANDSGPIYNLGLAHGVPSVIAFLCQAYHTGLEHPSLLPMIRSSVDWLINYHRESMPNCFPHFVPATEDDYRNARVAWCYGDLGVAVALLKAAHVLHSDAIYNLAVKLVDTVVNKNLTSSGVYWNRDRIDAGFCHGTGGISFILHSIYKITNQPSHLIKAQEWLALTLEANHNQPGTQSGFLKYSFDERLQREIWLEDAGLLEGIAGIGLVLLSFLNQDCCDWSRVFLIDLQ